MTYIYIVNTIKDGKADIFAYSLEADDESNPEFADEVWHFGHWSVLPSAPLSTADAWDQVFNRALDNGFLITPMHARVPINVHDFIKEGDVLHIDVLPFGITESTEYRLAPEDTRALADWHDTLVG